MTSKPTPPKLKRKRKKKSKIYFGTPVQNDLEEIDAKGSFKADDEVGTIFEQIKETVNQLESYRGEDVDAS